MQWRVSQRGEEVPLQPAVPLRVQRCQAPLAEEKDLLQQPLLWMELEPEPKDEIDLP